jgi:hypothetical protein
LGIRVCFYRPANGLPAFDGCRVGDAAGIYYYQSALFRRPGLRPTEAFEMLAYLLAFVLVDLAADSFDGKSFHNMV